MKQGAATLRPYKIWLCSSDRSQTELFQTPLGSCRIIFQCLRFVRWQAIKQA